MRFGVKAALSDAREMAALDVEILEIHLRPGDLPRHRDAVIRTFREVRDQRGLGLVMHAPECMMVAGRARLVDISSPDETMREMSVRTMVQALALAREVEATMMVLHPGGIMPPTQDPAATGGAQRLTTSLAVLGDVARGEGVALTLENMPWFYHNKAAGGEGPQRWVSTLMVRPEDADAILGLVDGLTLDVSHGFLHSPEGGMDVVDGFIERHGDHILHLHLSDALPPDHEGLQVGEGSVDFPSVLRAFRDRDVSAVPEIMGGHRGGGVSFRRALDTLRRIEAGL